MSAWNCPTSRKRPPAHGRYSLQHTEAKAVHIVLPSDVVVVHVPAGSMDQAEVDAHDASKKCFDQAVMDPTSLAEASSSSEILSWRHATLMLI